MLVAQIGPLGLIGYFLIREMQLLRARVESKMDKLADAIIMLAGGKNETGKSG